MRSADLHMEDLAIHLSFFLSIEVFILQTIQVTVILSEKLQRHFIDRFVLML